MNHIVDGFSPRLFNIQLFTTSGEPRLGFQARTEVGALAEVA